MIELKNVTRRFGDAVAVDRINLRVETGEVCVLVGSSGCGKSTTLRMINQLLPHSEGEILVDGKDVTAMNPEQLRLNMGYVIQGTGLFPHWTVAWTWPPPSMPTSIPSNCPAARPNGWGLPGHWRPIPIFC